MSVPGAHGLSRATRGHARRHLVRPAGAGHCRRLARGPWAVCGALARLGRPRFAERGDSAGLQAGRAGAARHDGAVRRGPLPAVIFRSMRGFLVRLLITALGLWVADQLLPGIAITGTGTLIVSALLLGFVNALIRPVIFILTLPLTILTLGLFILIVNGISVGLVAWLVPGFPVAGLWSAAWGPIIVRLTSLGASHFVGGPG